jgi:hypothetical protein
VEREDRRRFIPAFISRFLPVLLTRQIDDTAYVAMVTHGPLSLRSADCRILWVRSHLGTSIRVLGLYILEIIASGAGQINSPECIEVNVCTFKR